MGLGDAVSILWAGCRAAGEGLSLERSSYRRQTRSGSQLLFVFCFLKLTFQLCGFPRDTSGREPTCQCRGWLRDSGSIPGWEDPLEEGMAAHSSVLAQRIPWTEDPGGLQYVGLQRVGHD